MLDRDEIDALYPADLPGPEHWEERYPPRNLTPGAMVTRFCPSPTGFAHLGGVYVAILDKDLARQSGGAYFIRIEDTDQARTVEGATAQFDAAFGYFGVSSDESDQTGAYGPYTQSDRARIYLTYIREFLRAGKAYLCFATKEELGTATEEQRAKKVPTGYYGRWATWRDAADEQVRERLAAGQPYVVRFRSPGEPGRITFTDLVRGRLEADANRNDIVILKSSDSLLRLPTYHFAHVVDDHLMRVTHVIRGDEWLSSVPVHLQLFDAAGFERIPYAHIAPLLKVDGSGKRKLSKRKDPEASVEFYIKAGYPAPSVLYYLRGLINGRLAEMALTEALTAPLGLAECGVSGALVDLVKLEDIAADYVATLPSRDVLDEVLTWADTHDTELAHAVRAEQDLAVRALDIERTGVDNPRKDLRKWSDFRSIYGYFFTALFEPVADPGDSRFGGLAPDVVRRLCADLLRVYQDLSDSDGWFDQIRVTARDNDFAASVKEYKSDPGSYVGSIREASQVVRVLLTGSTRSPALHLVAGALGETEVRKRIGAVLGPS
ncbi:glutamate--tRNA ligase [Frankia sp. Cas3]|uniref:glutamate--tRNA ligase n=1 Tax=Frankia sp. Cas3 TaxID=3073926 RepID=UPI002AD43E41|nr:glutamate--tRNA ligase family protein [Frankia sp. Cas3]